MDPMLGMIFMVPWSWAPQDYQLCQGQVLNLRQYEGLFSLTGTVFGGNGSTTFGLPNLQGRTPIGTGTFTDSTGASYFTLGATTGAQATTLAISNLPPHNHGATFTPVTGNQTIAIPGTTGNLSVDVTLNATSNGGANAAPSSGASGNNMLSGAIYAGAKVYGPTSTTNLVPLTGLSTTISGNPSTPAASATISSVTGGSVAIGVTGNGFPFSNMQPSLAMSFVIAMNGIYPERP